VCCTRVLTHVCSADLALRGWESASAESVSKGTDSPFRFRFTFLQNEFKCLMDAPGLNKDNLGIEVDGDVLRVAVERSLPRCMKGDDENSVNWHRMERGPVRGSRYVI
jgi:HSP20 family molecular chaperone IbpA